MHVLAELFTVFHSFSSMFDWIYTRGSYFCIGASFGLTEPLCNISSPDPLADWPFCNCLLDNLSLTVAEVRFQVRWCSCRVSCCVTWSKLINCFCYYIVFFSISRTKLFGNVFKLQKRANKPTHTLPSSGNLESMNMQIWNASPAKYPLHSVFNPCFVWDFVYETIRV